MEVPPHKAKQVNFLFFVRGDVTSGPREGKLNAHLARNIYTALGAISIAVRGVPRRVESSIPSCSPLGISPVLRDSDPA